jgi:hypothetical protein
MTPPMHSTEQCANCSKPATRTVNLPTFHTSPWQGEEGRLFPGKDRILPVCNRECAKQLTAGNKLKIAAQREGAKQAKQDAEAAAEAAQAAAKAARQRSVADYLEANQAEVARTWDEQAKLLNASRRLALGDGTRDTDPTVPLADMSALVRSTGAGLAVVCAKGFEEIFAEVRRTRRDAYDTANVNVKSKKTQLDTQNAALRAPHLVALKERSEALSRELDELERNANRRRHGYGHGVAIVKGWANLPEGSADYNKRRAEWDAIGEQHEALRQQYNAILDQLDLPFAESKRLSQEWEAARAALSAAAASYRHWLEAEALWRRPPLEEQLRRHCLRCGAAIGFMTTVMIDPHGTSELAEFCSADCRRNYDELASEWFPRCDTCMRFFLVIQPDGTVDDTAGAVRARREVINPITSFECKEVLYCSPPCLLASPVDLDDWLPVDDEAWRCVIPVPHPRMTAAGRYADARRRVLEEAKRKAVTLRQAAGTSPSAHGVAALPVHVEAKPSRTTVELAVAWLRERLQHGEVPARETEQAAQEGGIAPRTLDRAKRILAVRSYKRGRHWFWRVE